MVKALNTLERKYGALFYKVFRSITVDNGPEFADCAGMEKACRRKGARTTVYYCHPYSSWERGSNERQNGMIRRKHPKGTDFATIPASTLKKITKIFANHLTRGRTAFLIPMHGFVQFFTFGGIY